jgi:hypothetical protein
VSSWCTQGGFEASILNRVKLFLRHRSQLGGG